LADGLRVNSKNRRTGDLAGVRQVEGATVGITANQGLFGHGSSVIVAR